MEPATGGCMSHSSRRIPHRHPPDLRILRPTTEKLLLHRLLSRRSLVAWLVLVVALLFAAGLRPAQAETRIVQSAKTSFHLNKLLDGLENPWSMAFLPDGRMLITERAGRLRIVTESFQLNPTPVTGLPTIKAAGQGGLFDVAIHPDYQNNGWIYWAYNEPGIGGWGTALARGKLNGMNRPGFRGGCLV